MAQMKEQIKAPEKIQLSDEEIASLSDAQFKTLVIRTLRELAELWSQNTGKREIKENAQGTNTEGKETGTQINGLEQKEAINIQPEENEETKFKDMRRGLGASVATLNIPTSES